MKMRMFFLVVKSGGPAQIFCLDSVVGSESGDVLLDVLLPVGKIGLVQFQFRFGTERDHAGVHVLAFLGNMTGDTSDFLLRTKGL
jgi:hypothetical protein